MTDRLAVCSWSGGKDSCFAFHTALSQGVRITHLVNTVANDSQRVRFHEVRAEIIQAQAEAIGTNLIQEVTSDDGYEHEFREALRMLKKDGVSSIVTGDINLEYSRDWIKKVADDLGLEVITPIWGRNSEEVLEEFIEAGFEATVVAAQADVLDSSWVGRDVDRHFLSDIKDLKGVDAGGENGEFHTLVTNGPIFKRRLEIKETKIVHKQSQWGSYRTAHWLLDILSYKLS